MDGVFIDAKVVLSYNEIWFTVFPPPIEDVYTAVRIVESEIASCTSKYMTLPASRVTSPPGPVTFPPGPVTFPGSPVTSPVAPTRSARPSTPSITHDGM